MPQLRRAKRQRQLFEEAPAVPGPGTTPLERARATTPGAGAVDAGAGQEDPQGGRQ